MSVRVTWTKGSATAFISLPQRLTDAIYGELAEAMGGIVEQGVQTAKEYTAERGRPTSAGAGRIETSDMIGSIKGEVELKAKAIIGKFGFIGKEADYFLYQTVTGFTHYLSGQFIEPTFALRDAGELAKQDMFEAIKAAIRNVRI